MTILKITNKRNKIIEHSITQITYNHINNYSNDVTNNYKINKVHNLKKTYYNLNDDITPNKTSNSYSNDTYNVTKNNNLFNSH